MDELNEYLEDDSVEEVEFVAGLITDDDEGVTDFEDVPLEGFQTQEDYFEDVSQDQPVLEDGNEFFSAEPEFPADYSEYTEANELPAESEYSEEPDFTSEPEIASEPETPAEPEIIQNIPTKKEKKTKETKAAQKDTADKKSADKKSNEKKTDVPKDNKWDETKADLRASKVSSYVGIGFGFLIAAALSFIEFKMQNVLNYGYMITWLGMVAISFFIKFNIRKKSYQLALAIISTMVAFALVALYVTALF